MLVSDISIYTYFYTLYSAENMQKPKFLRSKKNIPTFTKAYYYGYQQLTKC